ncbi:MAG TPA: secretin and TonB N-terminal domain-containing protein [Tepidisphaeraceae bacterium]|nr:secretin and TonB N-terminal domain-containing protein [Tepidisphaeraceae bacterium]
MRKWTKSAGVLFAAAAAALPTGAFAQNRDGDPFAPGANGGAATQPAENNQGQSVTDAQVNVSEEGTVEIHVNDANLNEVLRMLSLQLEKNILPSKEVRGTVTANLYDVTVREALDAILKANGFDYREKGNVIYVYTQKEIQEMEKAARVTKTEVFRLYYTPAVNASTMIKPVLSTDASVSLTTPAGTGISSDGADVGGNSHATEDILVVTDYPERLDQVRRVLKEIDRKPQQILVEATIMRATLSDNNSLGVDLAAVGGVDFSDLTGVQDVTPTGTGFQQSLNGTIIENPLAAGLMADEYAAGRLGGSGIKVGLVSNNVSVFIEALEGVSDTVVLANPKVLVLNKQKGAVHVGSELGYRTAITTETATADNVKFLEVGTRLNFRPYIGADGNIRMEIQPEDSSGTITSDELPNKFVTKVTSNVMVKDGHTIVIGGLFRESTITSKTQVPGLGNLPLIGGLFGKREDRTVREEVIILLTPHIVKDEAQYGELSEEQAKNAERVRVGVRKGLMPWGRERMADGHYQAALRDAARGRRGNALWHLGSAINLAPTMGDAHALRARLQREEIKSSDGSSIRGFVAQSVLNDRGAAAATQPGASAQPQVPDYTETTTPAEPDTAQTFNPDVTVGTGGKPAKAPQAAGKAAQPAPQSEAAEEPTEVTETPFDVQE